MCRTLTLTLRQPPMVFHLELFSLTLDHLSFTYFITLRSYTQSCGLQPVIFSRRRVERLICWGCDSFSEHAWSLLPNDAFMSSLLSSGLAAPPLERLTSHSLICFFHLLKREFIIFFFFFFNFLRKRCIPSFPTSPLPSSPSSLSGTITPSVVAVKREQMLELLPTQSTKPPTAGLWTLSLLLHSHKEHRAATPAPAQTSASHLQRDRVDRFTYTIYQGFTFFLKKK